MLKKSIFTSTVITAFLVMAGPSYAWPDPCPDTKGEYSRESEHGGWKDFGQTSQSVWIIPTKSTKVNYTATFFNLIKNQYMTKNRPRFTCIDGYENCTSNIDGSRFSAKQGDTRTAPMYIPDKSGKIVRVNIDSPSGSWETTSMSKVSCLNKTYTRTSLWFLRDEDDQLIPYLFLEREVEPIDVKYYGSGPSL